LLENYDTLIFNYYLYNNLMFGEIGKHFDCIVIQK